MRVLWLPSKFRGPRQTGSVVEQNRNVLSPRQNPFDHIGSCADRIGLRVGSVQRGQGLLGRGTDFGLHGPSGLLHLGIQKRAGVTRTIFIQASERGTRR